MCEEYSERRVVDVGERFVIVGAGVAAVSAAEQIRRLHSEASIVMIGEEEALPYHRPSLSRGLILPGVGERFALRSPEWYSRQGIFLLTGRRVTRLLPRTKQVELADGTVLSYDKCILATGRESVLPALEGVALPGVFTLRSRQDLERLARYLRPDMRAIVIGGGPLGLESAWQLFLGGCHVTVLEEAAYLLRGQVGQRVSERLIRIAAERGVEIRTGVRVKRLAGEDGAGVEQVILPGEYLNADLVMLCCGSSPRVELALEAGLEVGCGITVNSRMMTEKYGVYACGDCAELGRVLCSSVAVAQEMGRCAGRNAAGEDTLYRPAPAQLWMEAFGTRLFATGECGTWEDDVSEEYFLDANGGEQFLYRRAGRLSGAVLLGNTDAAQALIEQISPIRIPTEV